MTAQHAHVSLDSCSTVGSTVSSTAAELVNGLMKLRASLHHSQLVLQHAMRQRELHQLPANPWLAAAQASSIANWQVAAQATQIETGPKRLQAIATMVTNAWCDWSLAGNALCQHFTVPQTTP